MARSAEAIAELRKRIEGLKPWYHKIDLGDGIVTPGRDYDHMWAAVRNCMNLIDYQGKDVLDIASWDGLWAFEAERRGAANVVASDIRKEGWENFHLCKYALKSKVFHLANCPVQELPNRGKSSARSINSTSSTTLASSTTCAIHSSP